MASFCFYRCPNTGKVIRAVNRQEEVRCNCGRSNPAALEAIRSANWVTRFFSRNEHTEKTGTHLTRYLERATADEIFADAHSLRESDAWPVIKDLFS